MKRKILVTCALPYANGPLHFGHIAGAYLPGDCYARFQRLKGSDLLFISGTDEYGVAISLSAEMEGRTPREHVDHYHRVIKDFFQKLQISFDYFGRTTWPGHVPTVQQFFKDLLENGYIEAKITDQLFSEKENRFLADRYVIGTCPKCRFEKARGDECTRCGASYEATDLLQPRSKLTNSPLIKKASKHWFLRFDLFREQLSVWLSGKQWKPNVLNFALSCVEDLKPRAITRDSDWGIPVPLEEAKGKVLYVWFDAPIGYISATKEWAIAKGDPQAWKSYWLDPQTKYVQFLGKDNIPFHALFFPAMVMGQNEPYKLVDELPANEFFNLEGKKFSKSEGWSVDLDTFFQQFSADQIRYAIAANAPENQDAEFSWKEFQARCNNELLGKFGNLANRTLVFLQQKGGGCVPEAKLFGPEDMDFLVRIHRLAEEIAASYETFHLRRAAQLIMELAAAGNSYFDAKKPWLLARDAGRKSELDTVLFACLECLKTLALTSSPILPDGAQKLWQMLGYSSLLADQNWDSVLHEKIPSLQPLPPPTLLFTKIEDEVIERELAKLPKEPKVPEIAIEDVRRLDLRIGEILSVERIPKSKKLLKLLVDIGTAKRTIVAGIGEKLEDPATLVGKKVVVVTNLKPTTFLGVESQGMLLAAHGSDSLELPQVESAEPGSVVS